MASVPAAGENLEGADLAEARTGNPAIGFIVVPSENDEGMANVPHQNVTIRKPFSALELADAVDRATTMVELARWPWITLAHFSRETLPGGTDRRTYQRRRPRQAVDGTQLVTASMRQPERAEPSTEVETRSPRP